MDFEEYIRDCTKEELANDLRELLSSQQGVKSYFSAKLGLDKFLTEKYRERLIEAIYPDDQMNGGMDYKRVDAILQELRTPTARRYFVEVSLIGVEECSKIANEFGDADEDFFIYFEDLFEEVLKIIDKAQLQKDYALRLREIVDSAFNGYAHHDQLSDLYSTYFEE